MIISASRRTDIPAFHAEWFMTRVREGFFHRVNPFNSRQVTAVSLEPQDVDAICFWSKSPGPLFRHLDELDRRGLNYYFQFTLNPYDRLFEPNLPPLEERIRTMLELAARIGPDRVVWRYDPIILSGVTPVPWHLEKLDQLSGQLRHASRRLVISFYDFYGRGRGRLYRALRGKGIALEDIAAREQLAALEQVAHGFKAIAERDNLQIYTCSEELDLEDFGIGHGACIDGSLIRSLFGVKASLRKDKNQRKACNCIESADMGSYNCCGFRCAYCYANFSEGMIESNLNRHYPDSPALLGRCEGELEIITSLEKKKN